MERSKLLLFIVLTVLLNSIYAVNPSANRQLRNGIDLLLNGKFDSARNHFDKIAVRDTSMLPEIFGYAVDVLEGEHAGYYSKSDKIDSTFTSIQDSCQWLLSRMPNNLQYNYYLALLKSINAYYEFFRENYLEAYGDGYIASQYLEKCLTLDSASVEIRSARGNFAYWSSAKTESFHWLPFVEDDRVEGLRELELALNNDFLTADFLRFSLAWAYLNEQKFDEARKLIFRLAAKYPSNLNAKNLLGEYYSVKNPKLAIETYQKIFSSYKNLSVVKKVEIGAKLINLYLRLDAPQPALKISNQILGMEQIDEQLVIYLQDKINEVAEIRDSLNLSTTALPKK